MSGEVTVTLFPGEAVKVTEPILAFALMTVTDNGVLPPTETLDDTGASSISHVGMLVPGVVGRGVSPPPMHVWRI